MLIRILRKWIVLVAALMAIAAPALAQDASLTVEVRGQVTSLTPEALRALPPDTVRARAHDGPTQTFVGPSVATLLAHAGVQLDSLRGAALAQYVVVEARDGYRVVFAIAELSRAFTSNRVILAYSVDGEPIGADFGPWRIVAEGDLRPARWVRQVSAIRLRATP